MAMNLVIEVPRPVEARIEEEAHRAGVSPAELVAGLVRERFAPAPVGPEEQKMRNAPSIALLERWLAETGGEALNPEELRRAEEEAEQFKRGLDAPRKEAGARLLFPEAHGGEADGSA